MIFGIAATVLRRSFARRAMALAFTCAAVATALAAPQAVAAPAAPQSSQPTRIAVVNTQRVFNEMQEFKAFRVRVEEENKRLTNESNAKVATLQKMRAERDNNFRPGTPQHDDASKTIMEETAKLKVWSEVEKANVEFLLKRQTRQMFDKIQAATAEVARREGIDLVMVDTNEKLTDEQAEKLDFGKLQTFLLAKSVLYTSERSDITNMVILILDARYKTAAAGAGGK